MNNEINPDAPLSPFERVSVGAVLMWLLFGVIIVCTICGCKSDRAKDLGLNGMFTQAESGTVAIGSIEIQAAPNAAEAVIAKFWWDSPWLSPSKVRPCARLMVCGTNAVAKADKMIESMAKAVGVNHCLSTNVSVSVSADAD